jgi:ferredoxin
VNTVRVDADRCQTTGYCARIAPSVFRVPDDGPAQVTLEHPGEDVVEAVREAEDACPAAAIHLEG